MQLAIQFSTLDPSDNVAPLVFRTLPWKTLSDLDWLFLEFLNFLKGALLCRPQRTQRRVLNGFCRVTVAWKWSFETFSVYDWSVTKKCEGGKIFSWATLFSDFHKNLRIVLRTTFVQNSYSGVSTKVWPEMRFHNKIYIFGASGFFGRLRRCGFTTADRAAHHLPVTAVSHQISLLQAVGWCAQLDQRKFVVDHQRMLWTFLRLWSCECIRMGRSNRIGPPRKWGSVASTIFVSCDWAHFYRVNRLIDACFLRLNKPSPEPGILLSTTKVYPR